MKNNKKGNKENLNSNYKNSNMKKKLDDNRNLQNSKNKWKYKIKN